MAGPEDAAREQIDAALEAAGWQVQDLSKLNLLAGRGVAVREFPLAAGHGFADYLLYVDGQAVGVVEAKKEGTTLTGVEPQARPLRRRPTLTTCRPGSARCRSSTSRLASTPASPTGLDPDPRSRAVFHFHRPETLARLARGRAGLPAPRGRPTRPAEPAPGVPADAAPGTLPEVDPAGLRQAQLRAVRNLEISLRQNRPRALIQMATGSGKTFAARSPPSTA